MIDIVIDNRTYRIPTSAGELTVAKAIAIENLHADTANGQGEGSGAEEYGKRLLCLLTDIPYGICGKTDPGQISAFISAHLENILTLTSSGPDRIYRSRKRSWYELCCITAGYRPGDMAAAMQMTCSGLLCLFDTALAAGIL